MCRVIFCVAVRQLRLKACNNILLRLKEAEDMTKNVQKQPKWLKWLTKPSNRLVMATQKHNKSCSIAAPAAALSQYQRQRQHQRRRQLESHFNGPARPS